MPIFVIEPNQMDIFYNILSHTREIEKEYNTLCELECNSGQNSREYQECFRRLQKLLYMEEKLYASPELTPEICQALTVFVGRTKAPKFFPPNMESIVTMNYDGIQVRRIINKLSQKVASDSAILEKMMPQGLKEVLSSLGVSDVENVLKHGITTSVQFQRSLDKDALMIFLSCLEEVKKGSPYSALKPYFIKTKYMTSFAMPSIEQDMIPASFKVDESIYVSARFTADVLNIVNEAFMSLKNIYGIELANEQLNGLIQLSDSDYSSYSKRCEAILRQSLLRAFFFLISDDTTASMRKDFEDYCADNSWFSGSVSSELVKEAFDSIAKDKAKHKVYSLNPNVVF